MRNELEYLAEIENYILHPNEDHNAFEKKMQSDAALRQNVELIRGLIDGIQAQGIRNEIKRAKTNNALIKALKYLSITLIALVVLLAGVILYNNQTNDKSDVEIRTELPATNELGGTEWTQADSALPYLIYTISADEDEVIETPEGIIFSIPKGSFVDKSGNVITGEFELEIKEAMNPADIMKAGLSTWSDDRLLETGGMFYINARKDGENLQIAKDANVTSSIPKLQDRNDMMLFDGVRTSKSLPIVKYQSYGEESSNNELENGSTIYNIQINWINPRKPITDLVSVSMDLLNFYPPNFEKTLAEAGYPDKSKMFRDSVYLSFKKVEPLDQLQSVDTLISVLPNQGKFAEADNESDTSGYSPTNNFQFANGESLFKANCERCHNASDKNLIGPGLQVVRSRWKSEDDLVSFISNSGAFLATGDAYAYEIFTRFNKMAMPAFPELSKPEIVSILDYIDQINVGNAYGINPSSVLAFWNKEFNKTILATREFEKRMREIHGTCDKEILNCYTKNLDRPLYYCDSLAATKSYGEQQIRFQKFYSEGMGRPMDAKKITSVLLNVFAKKQRELDAAYNRTTGEYFRKQAKADEQAYKNESKQFDRNSNRDHHNFNDEYNTNLCEAKTQLGQSCKPVFSTNVQQNFNTFQIQTTGWKNVDAYVMDATLSRTSMNYVDPQTDKTATLTYSELNVSISNISSFDIVETYLIPSGKMSFMRMKKVGGNYKESLNALYQYHLVAVGYKGKKVALFTQENITAGSKSVTLKSSTVGEINRFISRNATQRASDDLSAELKYLDFKIGEIKRQGERLKVEQLRDILLPVVFPCGYGATEAAIGDSVSVAAPAK